MNRRTPIFSSSRWPSRSLALWLAGLAVVVGVGVTVPDLVSRAPRERTGDISPAQAPTPPTNVSVLAKGPTAATFTGGYYATTFAATENPLSESSLWRNGLAEGGSWKNVQTTNGYAFGTGTSGAPPYDDPTAVLTGTWTATQWACGHVYIAAAALTDAGTQEVELRLRSTITSGVNSGYEALFSVRSGNDYAQIVRWNGAVGNYTLLDGVDISSVLGRVMATGDEICFSAIGTALKSYINGVQMLSVTDGTFTSGNPGIGFWLNSPSTSVPADAGLMEFEASNGSLIWSASCSQGNITTAIGTAVDGDTVGLPACTTTLSSGVTISGKGIHLRGSGGGHVEGSSTTSRTPGTSPCTVSSTTCAFTLQPSSWITGFTVGETVTANFKARDTERITGTVTSWNSSTGVLTLTVASVVGSTARAAWSFSNEGLTKLTNNNVTGSGDLIAITEDTTHSTRVSGIQFLAGTSTGDMVDVSSGGASGKATLLHDLRCSMDQGGGTSRCIHTSVNRGIAWRVYFDCRWDWYDSGAGSGNTSICTDQGVLVNIPGITHASWTTVSTMGMADTTGTANFYLEDSYCVGLNQSFSDFDDNSRAVFRANVLDHCQLGSHGQETSAAGERHKEIYNNVFIFHDLATFTANINAWFYDRGGTGIVADNTMPNITSGNWGNKPEVYFTLLGLQRNSASGGVGHDAYACWGNGTSTYSNHGSDGPPYPRQHGYGYVTGSGITDPFMGYRGDFEPYYFWNNGSMVSPASVNDSPITCDGTTDALSDYIHVGASASACPTCEVLFSTDASAAKAGYTKYTYPHPLRTP